MAEIGMAGACGQDEVVVRNVGLGGLDHAPIEIEARGFCQQNFDVVVSAKNRANRRGDFSGGKTGGGYLVEKRLEGMVILAVDDGNLDRRFGQRLRRVQPSKAGAHNHYPRFYLAVHRPTSIRFGAMAEVSGSSSKSATPVWASWALPSVADLIFVALLGVLVFTPLSVRLLGDAGIGWHIRTGQQILATHTVPHVDPFSSSMGAKPWFAWEWLYDLAAGELERTLGLNGVVWFTSAVIATVFALAFRLLMQRGTNVLVALVLVLLALAASMIHFLARPHVLSWLFTLIWFWILDASGRNCSCGRGGRGRSWLWALPLLMLVWLNVHGGFLLGFALLGIFWMGAVWNWLRAKDGRIEQAFGRIAAGKRSWDLMWVGLLSAAASLVNPYGWKLHLHIASYLSNRFLMDHIEEFQSPNFHGVAQRCFVALLLITLAILARRGRELRMSQALTVLFAVYAGLYASRNIPVSSVLLVMVVGPLVPSTGLAGRFSQKMASVQGGLRGHLWPVVAILFTLWIAANRGRAGSTEIMDAYFDPKRMPVDAVTYLEKHDVPGPVLSPDYWGGYLIYQLYPKQRVVVDDRHDFYGEAFLKSYLKMMHVEPGWQEFLREHEVACLVLPRNAPLTNILLETRDWKPLYTDDVAIAFVRSSSTADTEPR